MRPLVSCICPTMRGREAFLRVAVESFLQSDYPNKEMVIVADGQWPHTVIPDYAPNVHVSVFEGTLGAKRNYACGVASGDIICHYDDDDISHSTRIYHQVQLMQESGKSVVGYRVLPCIETRPINVLEADPADPSKFVSRTGSRLWTWTLREDQAGGTSFCYRRDWWLKHPFQDINCGEDNAFYAEAVAAGEAISVDGGWHIMVTNHAGGISGRLIGGVEWNELRGVC